MRFIARVMEQEGYEVITVAGGEKAKAMLPETPFDILITDYVMKPLDGVQLMEAVLAKNPDCPVLMISGYGTVETALAVLKAGAFDYLPKPVGVDDLRRSVKAASEFLVASGTTSQASPTKSVTPPFPHIAAANDEMIKLCKFVEQIAQTDANLLITGEPGTGKHLIAKTIHDYSQRKNRPFTVVPCKSLTAGHLNHALCGHAQDDPSGSGFFRAGAMAMGGTVYLQDVGAMPMSVQEKLLAAINGKQFKQATGREQFTVDSRILSSSASNLPQVFHRELADKLSSLTIQVPPLRDRLEDVRPIVANMKKDFGESISWTSIDDAALRALDIYTWPGNVPELERAIRVACSRTMEGKVTLENLPPEIQAAAAKARKPVAVEVDKEKYKGTVAKNFLRAKQVEYESMLKNKQTKTS
jgi:DNA-binding NtrC family response regulator